MSDAVGCKMGRCCLANVMAKVGKGGSIRMLLGEAVLGKQSQRRGRNTPELKEYHGSSRKALSRVSSQDFVT